MSLSPKAIARIARTAKAQPALTAELTAAWRRDPHLAAAIAATRLGVVPVDGAVVAIRVCDGSRRESILGCGGSARCRQQTNPLTGESGPTWDGNWRKTVRAMDWAIKSEAESLAAIQCWMAKV